jgi:hypothetical protein
MIWIYATLASLVFLFLAGATWIFLALISMFLKEDR